MIAEAPLVLRRFSFSAMAFRLPSTSVAMKPSAKLSLAGLLIAVLTAVLYPQLNRGADLDLAPAAPPAAVEMPAAAEKTRPSHDAENRPSQPAPAEGVGFTSKRAWQEHFAKHGAEFGKVTAQEYLALAQLLRDAPRSGAILELVRSDGVITRFDKNSGGFVAFHRDRSIRTFFRPDDGESYFRRQTER
jgi:hypothetical protein